MIERLSHMGEEYEWYTGKGFLSRFGNKEERTKFLEGLKDGFLAAIIPRAFPEKRYCVFDMSEPIFTRASTREGKLVFEYGGKGSIEQDIRDIFLNRANPRRTIIRAHINGTLGGGFGKNYNQTTVLGGAHFVENKRAGILCPGELLEASDFFCMGKAISEWDDYIDLRFGAVEIKYVLESELGLDPCPLVTIDSSEKRWRSRQPIAFFRDEECARIKGKFVDGAPFDLKVRDMFIPYTNKENKFAPLRVYVPVEAAL